MTPEEINKLVAEACGWKDVHMWTDLGPWVGVSPTASGLHHRIPNFWADLNACAEMERTLECGEDRIAYAEALSDIIETANPDNKGWSGALCAFVCLTATAPQRCEAFLRTKGLWR